MSSFYVSYTFYSFYIIYAYGILKIKKKDKGKLILAT